MKLICNNGALKFYLKKFNLDAIFQDRITSLMQLHLYNKNESIYRSGVEIDFFYFLVEGKAKVYSLSENGRVFQIDFAVPLDILGDLEFLGSSLSLHNVESIEKSILIGIPMESLKQAVEHDAEFYKFICKFLSRKLSNMSQHLFHNLIYPLKNRFATYIYELIPRGEYKITKFKIGETSDILGTSTRHLSRVIKEFSNEGILKKENSTIYILDIKKLKGLTINQ